MPRDGHADTCTFGRAARAGDRAAAGRRQDPALAAAFSGYVAFQGVLQQRAIFGSRFGTPEAERTVAREAWSLPQFAFFRWFAQEPLLLRVDAGNPSACAWFQDLRFFTPGRSTWPFRYGMCREGGEWRTYRLLGENTKTPIP